MTTPAPHRPAGATGRIARSAGAVSIAVMCSRVLGLIREQVFASLFGMLLWDEIMPASSWLAIALIIAGAIVVSLSTRKPD